jgi:small nuclear ribonucleoprotein (snRNP)-like protein
MTVGGRLLVGRLKTYSMQSALHLHTVRLLTEGDDTRGCGDTTGPPEDE